MAKYVTRIEQVDRDGEVLRTCQAAATAFAVAEANGVPRGVAFDIARAVIADGVDGSLAEAATINVGGGVVGVWLGRTMAARAMVDYVKAEVA